MGRKDSIIAARLIFVIYLGVVVYLCFGHFDQVPSFSSTILGIPADKVVHFCMFFPFVPLSYFAAGAELKSPWLTLLLIVALFVLGAVIAAATEIGQGLTAYRSRDPLDFRADVLSLAAGSALTILVYLWRRLR